VPNTDLGVDPDVVRKKAISKTVVNLAVFLVVLYMIGTSAISTWNAVVGTQTRATLIDCAKPDGKCAQENQKRTAAVVKKLVNEINETRHVSILAAACATDPAIVTPSMNHQERIDAVDVCVQKELQREEQNK
jgi:hypothetical protein